MDTKKHNELPRVEGYRRVAKLPAGDFGAQFYKDVNEVRVPGLVIRAAHRALPSLRSGSLVTDFLNVAFTRGSVMALTLDWAPSDVFDAAKKLDDRLVKSGVIKQSCYKP